MSTARRLPDPTTWGVSTLQLQRPATLYCDGAVRPWNEGLLHVSTEAVTRGLNVFEGLKGYWQESGGLAFRTIRTHYDRLCRSARILHIPIDFSYEHFFGAISSLAEAEATAENDLYCPRCRQIRGGMQSAASTAATLTGLPAALRKPIRRSVSRAPAGGTRYTGTKSRHSEPRFGVR